MIPREIDALVADRVMGWKHHHEDAKDSPGWEAGACYEGCGSEPGDWNYDEEIPHYSTTGDGALAVIEEMMRGKNYAMNIDCFTGEVWVSHPQKKGSGYSGVKPLPLAVSLASLEALGVEVDA